MHQGMRTPKPHPVPKRQRERRGRGLVGMSHLSSSSSSSNRRLSSSSSGTTSLKGVWLAGRGEGPQRDSLVGGIIQGTGRILGPLRSSMVPIRARHSSSIISSGVEEEEGGGASGWGKGVASSISNSSGVSGSSQGWRHGQDNHHTGPTNSKAMATLKVSQKYACEICTHMHAYIQYTYLYKS